MGVGAVLQCLGPRGVGVGVGVSVGAQPGYCGAGASTGHARAGARALPG